MIHALDAFLIALTLLASALTTAQVALVVSHLTRRKRAATTPLISRFGDSVKRFRTVSIIKPICGIDDELEQNLESFASLRGTVHEIIFSIADPADPALPIVRAVIDRHPRVPWKCVIGGDPRLELRNRKIARLIAAMRHASGDIILISDSNVRVQPDDLAATIAAFDDPHLGCVSNPFTAAGVSSVGATIESLHLLGFVLPGAVTAAVAGIPCVVGKSMAIRRDLLDAIGGFEAFSTVLAEDQAIGLAVRRAGYRLELTDVVVRNIVVRRTIRRALDRQIRWNKIRFAFSRIEYASEFLLFPLAYALLATLLAPATGWLLPVVLGMRALQLSVLAKAARVRFGFRECALIPVYDLLHFAAQFVPWFDDRVTWRGHSTRLGRNTEIVDIAEAA